MLVLGVDVRKQRFAVQLSLTELEGHAQVDAVEGVNDLGPVARQVKEASDDVTGAKAREKGTKLAFKFNRRNGNFLAAKKLFS